MEDIQEKRLCEFRKCTNSLDGKRKHARFCCRKHKDCEKNFINYYKEQKGR